MPQTAVIIGAGPAGLTAAYELLERTAIKPIVLEASEHMGGIARTVNYKGNRIDIGGHRFFSKSDRVMDWWLRMLPLQALPQDGDGARQTASRTRTAGERSTATATAPIPSATDRGDARAPAPLAHLLPPPASSTTRSRSQPDTLRKLGLWRSVRIGVSLL